MSNVQMTNCLLFSSANGDDSSQHGRDSFAYKNGQINSHNEQN